MQFLKLLKHLGLCLLLSVLHFHLHEDFVDEDNKTPDRYIAPITDSPKPPPSRVTFTLKTVHLSKQVWVWNEKFENFE